MKKEEVAAVDIEPIKEDNVQVTDETTKDALPNNES